MTTTSRRLRRLAGAAMFGVASFAYTSQALASTSSPTREAATAEASRSGIIAYNSSLTMQSSGEAVPLPYRFIFTYNGDANH